VVRRLSLDVSGEESREWRVVGVGDEDGSIHVAGHSRRRRARVAGTYRDSVRFVSLDDRGTTRWSLTRLSSSFTISLAEQKPRGQSVGGSIHRIAGPHEVPGPYFRSSVFAAGSRGVYYFDEGRAAVEIFSSDGIHRRTALMPIAVVGGGQRVAKPVSRNTAQELGMHPVRGGGSLWIEAVRSRVDGPRNWLILDFEGRLTGSATTPAGDRILEIGEDYLLTLRTNSNGIQATCICQLTRAPAR
jgi:hypothetical protein